MKENSQKGEIATIITLVGLVIIGAGIIAGGKIIEKGTRTAPKAATVLGRIQGLRHLVASSPGYTSAFTITVTRPDGTTVGAYTLNTDSDSYSTGDTLPLGSGSYTVTTNRPPGYTVYSSVCYNCISHPANQFVVGNSIQVNIPATPAANYYTGYVDLHFWYVPVPNCTGLTGPDQIIVNTPATYNAYFSSNWGNLSGEIVAGQNGQFIWAPGSKSVVPPPGGIAGPLSFTWTPTVTGTYDFFCRAWNDSIAECRANSAYVDAPPRFPCEGDTVSINKKQVTVINAPLTPTPAWTSKISGKRIGGTPNTLTRVVINALPAYDLSNDGETFSSGDLTAMGNTFTVKTSFIPGYDIYYSVCSNTTDHTNCPYQPGNATQVDIPAAPPSGSTVRFADVAFKFVAQPTNTPVGYCTSNSQCSNSQYCYLATNRCAGLNCETLTPTACKVYTASNHQCVLVNDADGGICGDFYGNPGTCQSGVCVVLTPTVTLPPCRTAGGSCQYPRDCCSGLVCNFPSSGIQIGQCVVPTPTRTPTPTHYPGWCQTAASCPTPSNPNFFACNTLECLNNTCSTATRPAGTSCNALIGPGNAVVPGVCSSGNCVTPIPSTTGTIPPTVIPSRTPIPTATPSSSSQRPYDNNGNPWSIPGTIEAEDFDEGGEGIAYHDNSQTNEGGKYRDTAVDVESNQAGGYSVGWTRPGEWLEYTVDVGQAGIYTFQARVANQYSGGKFHIEFGGVDKTGSVTMPITVPNTGGWYNWQEITIPNLSLSRGGHIMKVSFDIASSSPSQAVGNFDWFRFTSTSAQPSITPSPTPSCLNGEKGNLDCSSDGCVNTTDFELFRQAFGKLISEIAVSSGHHTPKLANDCNFSNASCLVGTADYEIFRQNFGTCGGS